MSGEYKIYKESYKVREKTTWVHVVFSLKIKYQQILSAGSIWVTLSQKKGRLFPKDKVSSKSEIHLHRFTDKQVSDLYPYPRQEFFFDKLHQLHYLCKVSQNKLYSHI